jgi:hypothetical protein
MEKTVSILSSLWFLEPRHHPLYPTKYLFLRRRPISPGSNMEIKVFLTLLAISPADQQPRALPQVRRQPCIQTAPVCNQYTLLQHYQMTTRNCLSLAHRKSKRLTLFMQEPMIQTVYDVLTVPYLHHLLARESSSWWNLSPERKSQILIIINSKHINRHELPYQCRAPTCDHRAATQRDLDRHHAAAHNIRRPNQPQYVYHCSIADCNWSPIGTINGFARSDHAKRHIDNLHHGQNAVVIRTRIQ